MKLFIENKMKDDFKGTISYLKSKDNRNKDHEILQSEFHQSLKNIINAITDEDAATMEFNAFINSNIISKNKDNNIETALKYFYTTIMEKKQRIDNFQNYLRKIRDTVLDILVVKITSTTDEDSYTIFEILNARGLELSTNELLKNYIMRYIQPTERRDDAKVKWEEMERKLGSKIEKFIKHYVTHYFGDIRKKFDSPYQAIQKITREEKNDIGKLFDDLKLKSEYYEKIVNPRQGDCYNCTKLEYSIFNFFRQKRFELFNPILLSLIHQHELYNITQNDYEQTLKYIYNFFVCYTIIGEEKSNKLEDTVYKYANQLEWNFSEELLLEFTQRLKSKIPNLEWFTNVFKNIGWSNDHYALYSGSKNKNRVQIIIEIIEKHISGKDTISEFTLEHILPDNEDILHSQIGNFIPLESKYNQKCSTKPLNEKIKIYLKSEFALARGFADRYRDKEFDPSKRTEYFAKLIYNKILKLN